MVAREVESAAGELRTFTVGVWEHFGLAVVVFGAALGATQLYPALALPFLAGGILSLGLGVRDAARRCELIDRLVLDRDAHRIPAVHSRAAQAATMERRNQLATSIRALLAHPELVAGARVDAVAPELVQLAADLDDERLSLDPASAVRCAQLVGEVAASPLRNPAAPIEDARAGIRAIRSGFTPRPA